MPLNPRDHAAVQAISRADVEKTLAGLRRFTKKSAWVGKNNRYTEDTTNVVDSEIAAGALISPLQLSQYIAASCLLHCSDGWSYLGKSISAILRGDPHRSRHLAYYAELRAAMSLLASVGIGVFNAQHFVISAPRAVAALKVRSKTHNFVWDCLEFWGDQNASGALFANIIRPNGRSLDDWLQPVGGAAAAAPQARQWFLQWGMDLKMPIEDKYARNESSYRPDGMPASWRLDTPTTLKFTREFWTALEPAPASRFDAIDRHILRITLESVYRGTTGLAPRDNAANFRRFVDGVIERQGFASSVAAQWSQFLRRRKVSRNLSILDLSKLSPETRKNSHKAVLSRAALLLRVASGSAAELMQAAGFTTDALSFWWGGIGNTRGLWDGARASDSLTDLWADIEPLLRSIDAFQASNPKTAQTFHRVGTELGHTLAGLGSCERVAVWGVIST